VNDDPPRPALPSAPSPELSQELLDRAGRLAGVGGWSVDLIAQAVYWSPQTCLIHGLPPGSSVELEAAMAFYPEPGRSTLRAAFEHTRVSGEPFEVELPFITADGRSIWVQAIGEAQREAGRTVRVFGAFMDVTRRRQMQAGVAEARARTEELRREQALRAQAERHAEELDRLLRERNEMLDVLAHEVRQPLNNAQAALQAALQGDHAEGAAGEPLRRAHSVIQSVVMGVDNLLAVSSLLVGADDTERFDVELELLLQIALADLNPADRARVQQQRGTLIQTVRVDAGLMRLALRNLLLNALAYSPPGSPVVLRTSEVPAGGGFAEGTAAVAIDVIDQGAGIPPELLPRLFQRGVRGATPAPADAQNQNRAPGRTSHGLGLYIARRAMALQQGEVVVLHTGPQGTAMRVVIRDEA
jgi:PAS domain S-box-containing protein